ncbi:MAG: NADH-quinone oxidoreductase subunit F [Syntrophus sp. (in: bacteria)]|nr:NADH-quinone oxidoreductase subunit F [Syntrophus sp. (in: bacteria)]
MTIEELERIRTEARQILAERGERFLPDGELKPPRPGEVRVVLRNCGQIDPKRIEEYIAKEGYFALHKILNMTPEQVIDETKRSGLRGRGGAGFPAGQKWFFARQALASRPAPADGAPPAYLICNGDEGDPGAFMDRAVLEGDPHSVLEGMAIAAYAMGATQGYVYVRAEYPVAVEHLQTALPQARRLGLLGKNIFGKGFDFDVDIRIGAGAFVCGEETALIDSIEGRRGEPRPRPPFPAVSGLWGRPTSVNNVETLANVPQIFLKGADWFAGMGTEKSKGTKTFAIAGKVKNAGLIEVPMGITMREIIYDIGGGILNKKEFKAAQTGGPLGGCLPAKYLDTPIDFESLVAAGSLMGSGGLIVLDENDCMVDVARFFMDFTQDESCGKCPPCWLGTKRLLEILTRITRAEGTEKDLETLEYLTQNISTASLCALGQGSVNPVVTTMRHFRDEYEAHVRDKFCSSGVCKGMFHYEILADTCNGCGACRLKCPDKVIKGAKKAVHEIDQANCIVCGDCYKACKFAAIAIRPRPTPKSKLPECG